jgi:vitamin B12 transporter
MSMLISPLRQAAAVAALSLSPPSLAQPAAPVDPSRLDPVVITAARIEQPLDEALPVTTLLTRAQIDRSQAADLIELLARQPGVEFARSGGPGGQSSLFVRGAGSSQVLVLLDGVRLNSALAGAAVLGGVQLDTIERIEIVRGNLSSLYGSEAIGGVIQIFTRRAPAPGATVGAGLGSGRSRAAHAAVAAPAAATRFNAAAAYRESRPFSAIDAAQVVPGPFAPGANADIDGDRSGSASLRLEHDVDPRLALGLSGWARRNETDFDSTADGPQATHRESSRAEVAQAYGRLQVAPAWTTRLTAAQANERSRNRSSAPLSFNNGEFDARNRQTTLANEVAVAPRVTASLGAEYLDQRGSSTSYDPAFAGRLTSFSRRVLSGWFGTVGRTDTQSVQVNLRHDDYSDVGSARTGLLAYGYHWSPAWRMRVQASNAFRAPSFNDLYFPFFGNPALRPEKATSAEAGVRYAAGALSAGLTLYQTRTRDLIVFDPVRGSAANLARARVRGAELAAAWTAGRWQVSGNATVGRAEDADSGERLPRRAPVLVNAAAHYDAGPWTAGAELARVGARHDFDINTFDRTGLDSYSLLRLLATWRISPSVTARVRIENALDERYELVDGYNTPRRGVFAGVEVRL